MISGGLERSDKRDELAANNHESEQILCWSVLAVLAGNKSLWRDHERKEKGRELVE